MNPIEQSLQFSRDLVAINAEWLRKLAEFDSQSVQKYLEFNQGFGNKLPEVKDLQAFFELQRTYAEQLWNDMQETFRARGELLREAMEANGAVWRRGFEAMTPAEMSPAA